MCTDPAFISDTQYFTDRGVGILGIDVIFQLGLELGELIFHRLLRQVLYPALGFT